MNKKIFAGVGVAVMMAFLAGCDEIKFGGTLTVHESMTFAQTRQDPSTCDQAPEYRACRKAGNVVLNPGQFQTRVILGTSGQEKQIRLEVKNNGNDPTVVDINFDKNIETNDHFVLKAGQIGQNFDLAGDIATKVTRTPEESAHESCTYQVQEMVCRNSKSADTEAEPTDGLSAGVEDAILEFGKQAGGNPGPYPGQYGHPPAPNCHPVWVTRIGRQYVRFFYETTTKEITAGFVQADKDLADYKGSSSKTEKIYTFQSVCR